MGQTCDGNGACVMTAGCGACGSAETCLEGVCRANTLLCTTNNPVGLCQNGFDCLEGTCVDAGSGCSSANPSGTCAAGSLCSNGRCVAIDGPSLCDDGSPCTADAFDPAQNRCTHSPVSGACNDGNSCTTDVCAAGACASSPISGCIEPPAIDPYTTPTKSGTIQISGTKPAGASIEINGLEAVPESPDTRWTVSVNLSPGLNTFVIRSVDQGNPSATVEVRIVFDITPPNTLATPGGGVFLNGLTVTVASDEPAEVFYTTDGGTPDEYSPSFTSVRQFRVFSDTRLSFKCRDLAGNWETAVKTFDFEVTSHGNRWDNGPTLPEPLTHVGATFYDGKLYVLGGSDGIAPQAGFQVYDLVTSGWTSLASLPGARSQHTLIAHAGKLYAIGGDDHGTPLNSVLEFDPASSTSWGAKAPMPSTRSGIATVSASGMIWVFGGKGNGDAVLDRVETYDANGNVWSNSVAQMPRPRYAFGAVEYLGKIYLIGGQNGAGVPVAEVDIYDIGTDAWSQGAPMPTPRSFLAVHLDENIGRIKRSEVGIVAAGGKATGGVASAITEEYMIESDTWRTRAPLARARHSAASVSVEADHEVDRRLEGWMVGGQLSAGLTDTMVAFSIDRDETSLVAALPEARYRHAATALFEKVYVFGGRSFTEQATAWAFDPETLSFTILPPLASLQNGLVAVADGRRAYAIGGADGFGNAVAHVRAFDPATGTWAQKASMTTARSEAAATLARNEIWVIGGTNNGALQTVEVYDTERDSWRSAAVLPEGRTGAVAAYHHGDLYLLGGRNSAGDVVGTIYRYRSGSWSELGSEVPVAYASAIRIHDSKVAVYGGRLADGSLSKRVYVFDVVTEEVTSVTTLLPPTDLAAAAYVNGGVYLLGGNTTANDDPPGELAVLRILGRCVNGVPDGGESEADSGAGCTPSALYSYSFPGGSVSVSDPACLEWNDFLGQIPDSGIERVTIRGSFDTTGRTCRGAAAQQLCTALRNRSSTSVFCDGRSWVVGNCGSGTEITAGGTLCNCLSPGWTARPCIGSSSWGGVNRDTCADDAQAIEVSCE